MGCCLLAGLFLEGVWKSSLWDMSTETKRPAQSGMEALASGLGRRWKLWLLLIALAEVVLAVGIVTVLIALVSGSGATVAAPEATGSGTATHGSGHHGTSAIHPPTLFVIVCAVVCTLAVPLLQANLAPLGTRGDQQPAWRHPLVAVLAALAIATIPFTASVEDGLGGSHLIWVTRMSLVLTVAPALLVAAFSRRAGEKGPAPAWMKIGSSLAVTMAVAVVYLWHIPAAHVWSMQETASNAFSLATLFAAGLVLWAVILGDRRASTAATRLVTLLVASTIIALLALAMIIAPVALYGHAGLGNPFGVDARGDQVLAGIVMLLVDAAFIIPAAISIYATVPRTSNPPSLSHSRRSARAAS